MLSQDVISVLPHRHAAHGCWPRRLDTPVCGSGGVIARQGSAWLPGTLSWGTTDRSGLGAAGNFRLQQVSRDFVVLSDTRPTCLPIYIVAPAKDGSAGEHMERNPSGLCMEGNVRGTGRNHGEPCGPWNCVHTSWQSGLGKLPSSLVPRFPLWEAREDNNAYGIVLW